MQRAPHPAEARPAVVLARLLVPAASAALLAGCGASEAAEEGLRFVEIGAEVGLDHELVSGDPRRWYIPESNGCGAAWLDVDVDGDFDLFVGDGSGVEYVDDGARLEVLGDGETRLYRNDGEWALADVTLEWDAARSDWVQAVSAADADGDGDPDLYLACFGEDVYLENVGDRFVERTAESGLGNPRWGTGAAFGDVDNDGELDLYVANYVEFDPEAPPLGGRRAVYDGVEVGWGPEEENGQGFNVGAPDGFWIGLGGGRFREATAERGFELERGLCSYAAVFSDVDLDGWQDLAVANDLQPCNLFHNDGTGHFEDEAEQRGFALGASGEPTAAMGLAVADVDLDGDPDFLRTNFDLEPNSLHLNDGTGSFTEAAGRVGLERASVAALGWGAAFFDAELDGDLDLVVANGHVMPQAAEIGMTGWAMPTQLFEGSLEDGRPRFVERGAAAGFEGEWPGRGVALSDADADGDLDVLVVDLEGRPRLYENRSGRAGHWLAVDLEGTRSNRDGLGARVVVETEEGTRFTREMRRQAGLYSSHEPRAHFGLGPTGGVRAVTVHWPSGTVQRVEGPALDAVLSIREPQEVSR